MSRSVRPACLGLICLGLAMSLAACGGGATSAPGPEGSLPPGTLAVEAKEYQFTPSTITVPAGSVLFSIRNAGTQEHEFEIFKGEQLVDEVEGIVPGLTRDVSVNLEAGDYTFLCKLNGHDQLGMKGALTVTSG